MGKVRSKYVIIYISIKVDIVEKLIKGKILNFGIIWIVNVKLLVEFCELGIEFSFLILFV